MSGMLAPLFQRPACFKSCQMQRGVPGQWIRKTRVSAAGGRTRRRCWRRPGRRWTTGSAPCGRPPCAVAPPGRPPDGRASRTNMHDGRMFQTSTHDDRMFQTSMHDGRASRVSMHDGRMFQTRMHNDVTTVDDQTCWDHARLFAATHQCGRSESAGHNTPWTTLGKADVPPCSFLMNSPLVTNFVSSNKCILLAYQSPTAIEKGQSAAKNTLVPCRRRCARPRAGHFS